MKKVLKPLLIAMAVAPLLASCMKSNSDYPQDRKYVTVASTGLSYYFVGDDGTTYFPGDVSRFKYDASETDGKRAIIWFTPLAEKKEGFDMNIALYSVADLLSKSVETAETIEQAEAAGNDQLAISDAAFQGDWLDIAFRIMISYDSKHHMTLLDNKTATAPETTPADYQYLEFRQKAENMQIDESPGEGIVSYKLGAYHPALTGKKGFYIRIINLNGNVEYVKIDYKAPEEKAAMQPRNIPTPNMDRIR